MTIADAIEVFDIRQPFTVLVGMVLFFGVIGLLGWGCRKFFDREDKEP